MKLTGEKKYFYGWWVAAACLLMTFVALGLGNSTKGLYVTPVTEDLGIERGLFSLTFSIREIVKACANLLFGTVALKLGMRRVAALGFGCLGVSYVLFSVSNGLPVFYFGGVLLGVGVTFTSTATVSAIIRNWFVDHRGTILGVVLAGSGLGGSLFSLLVGRWLELYGWRGAYRITAIIMFVMILPMVAIIRNRPADLGQTALGEGNQVQAKGHNVLIWTGPSAKALVKKPYFWVLVVGAFCFGLLTNPVVVAFPSHLTDLGFDAAFASQVSSVTFLILAGVKVLTGFIYDRAGIRVALTISFAGGVIGCLLLAFCSSHAMAYMFSAVFAFVLPLETLMIPLVVSDLIGQRSYTHFVGVFLALMSAGIAVGTPVINFSYDVMGSYTGVLVALAIFSGMVYAGMMWACGQAAKLHEREAAGEILE